MTGHREDELLLRCVRNYVNPSGAERIENVVRQGIDWEKVIRTALDHRVMPLLYHSLHAFCPEAVPEVILHRLQELFRSNATRNLFLVSELLKLLKLLESHGIRAIAFKGPVLALYAYGNLSLRQQVDLDILVQKRDFFEAKCALLSNGYRLWREMTEKQELGLLQSNHAFAFLPEPPTYSVDLHWAIAQPHHANGLNNEALWERVESISLGGTSVATFRPEEMMLVLAVHGAKHSWQHLGWICDIAQLVRSRPDLNWQRLIGEADKAGCMKALLLALELVKNVVGGSLPEDISQMIDRSRKVKVVARSVTRRLFSDKRSVLVDRFQQIFIVSRLKQRIRDRFLHLSYEWRGTVTPNEKDHALLSLPVAFYFLYYFVRPIRLTVAYGLSRLIRSAKQWLSLSFTTLFV